MFPIGLERQNELTFVRFFEKFAKKFGARVIEAVYRELKDKIRTDDSGDLLRFLSNLAGEVDEIPEDELARILTKNYQMIDSWAQDIVSKELSTIASLSDIEAISIASIPEMNQSLIEDAVRQGLEAYRKLTEGFKDLVYQVTLEGIRDGLRASEIAKNIRNATGMKIKNAAFYGRDLASDVFGQVSLRRQTAAGFQFYEWRTMNDERVRDYHTDNQKEIFSWAKGADNLKKPGARHPGEDYNCRCYAKPIRDTESAWIQIEKQKEARKEAKKKKPGLDGLWKKHRLDNPDNWTEESVLQLKRALKKSHGIKVDDVANVYDRRLRVPKASRVIVKNVRKYVQEFLDMMPENVIKSNKFMKGEGKINFGIVIEKASNIKKDVFGSYHNGLLQLNPRLNEKQLKETIYHEMMHWVHLDTQGEWGDKFRAKIREIFQKRTSGEPTRKRYGIPYKEDKWYNWYAGREYPGLIGNGVEVPTVYFELLADEKKMIEKLSDKKGNPESIPEILKIILGFLK